MNLTACQQNRLPTRLARTNLTKALLVSWTWSASGIGALWSYNGWADISFIAEEVCEPGRTLPRALIGGSVLIIGLYLLVNAGYFYALEPQTVANVPEASSVAGVLMVRMLGAGGASLLTIGMMLSTFGALHSHFSEPSGLLGLPEQLSFACSSVCPEDWLVAREGLVTTREDSE